MQNVTKLRDAARRMQQGGAVEAAFAPKGNTQLIPNSYQMSKGSLVLPTALVPKTSAESGASFADGAFADVGKIGEIAAGTYTSFDLWRILFGLQPGDQLTFPQIYGEGFAQTLTGAGGAVLDRTLFTDFCAPRIVLKSTIAEDPGITLVAGQQASIVNEMMLAVDTERSWFDVEEILDEKMNFTFKQETDMWELEGIDPYDETFAINNDDPLRAIGCIRSHKDVSTGKWEYSTSDLVCAWVDGNRGQYLGNYFGFMLNNAIDTYKKNVILDSDGNFLQRGTDDNIVPPSFQ